MKLLIGLLLSLSFFAPVPQSDIKLEIGAKLNRKYIPRKAGERIFTYPSQTRPFIKRKVNGIKYIIAFDEKSLEIRYISTDDKKFRTENGLRVGSEITLTRDKIIVYPSWEIQAPATPDGWYPIVGYDLPKLGALTEDAFLKSDVRNYTIVGFSKGGN